MIDFRKIVTENHKRFKTMSKRDKFKYISSIILAFLLTSILIFLSVVLIVSMVRCSTKPKASAESVSGYYNTARFDYAYVDSNGDRSLNWIQLQIPISNDAFNSPQLSYVTMSNSYPVSRTANGFFTYVNYYHTADQYDWIGGYLPAENAFGTTTANPNISNISWAFYNAGYVGRFDSTNYTYSLDYYLGAPDSLTVTYSSSYKGLPSSTVSPSTATWRGSSNFSVNSNFIEYRLSWNLARYNLSIQGVSSVDFILYVVNPSSQQMGNDGSYTYLFANADISDVYNYGYGIGYNAGIETGYNQGRLEAFDVATDSAYNNGYNVGYVDGMDVALEDVSPFDVVVEGVNSFLDITLFGGFKISTLFYISMGLALFFMLLKVFLK